MKKYMLITLAVAALLVSAFGGSYNEVIGKIADSTADDTAPTPQAGTPGAEPKDGERPISDQERFIIGVYSLENTDLAVSAEQADSLIPLWTSMKEFSRQPQAMPAGTPEATPDAAAEPVEPVDNSAEISALFEQIEAVLTADQLAAITALELDQAAVMTFMEEQGIEMSEGAQPGQNGQDGQTPPAGTPSGDQAPAPQGTPAADGQQPGGEGQPDGGRGGMQVASQNLIDALIELLETK